MSNWVYPYPKIVVEGGTHWWDIRSFVGATLRDKLLEAITQLELAGGGHSLFCPAGNYGNIAISNVTNIALRGEIGTKFETLTFTFLTNPLLQNVDFENLECSLCSHLFVYGNRLTGVLIDTPSTFDNCPNLHFVHNFATVPGLVTATGFKLSDCDASYIEGNYGLGSSGVNLINCAGGFVNNNYFAGSNLQIEATSSLIITRNNTLKGGDFNDFASDTYSEGDIKVP